MAAKSLTVLPGANEGGGVAEEELKEADADPEEEEAEKEEPVGEPGGGGDAPPAAAAKSSFPTSSSAGRGLFRGDWAREVGKKGKTGEAFAGLNMPSEPPVHSPLPEAPADAAANIKGESATREVGKPMLSGGAIASANAEAIKGEEEEGKEEV